MPDIEPTLAAALVETIKRFPRSATYPWDGSIGWGVTEHDLARVALDWLRAEASNPYRVEAALGAFRRANQGGVVGGPEAQMRAALAAFLEGFRA
jgi:hypothetical protein